MKYVLASIFILFSFSVQSQDTIVVKTTRDGSILISMPKEKHSILKSIIPFLPLISIIVAFIGFFGIAYQIRARRKDDILNHQLNRLNKQITEFYGPLYSLYETGHQNFYAYLELYGFEFDFNNPNFKQWDISIFQPTNFKMEDIIISKADLIIGNIVPEFFFQFCEWVTAKKAYFNAESQVNFDNEIWIPILDNYKHPEDQMRMYIKASFEVLKKTQSEVLSGRLKSVNEEKLTKEITQLKETYLKDPEVNKWEESVWRKVRFNERRAEFIYEQEKLLIKNSPIPNSWTQ